MKFCLLNFQQLKFLAKECEPDQTVLADSNTSWKGHKTIGNQKTAFKVFLFDCSHWLPLMTADIQPRQVDVSINEVRLITINASNLEQTYNEPISEHRHNFYHDTFLTRFQPQVNKILAYLLSSVNRSFASLLDLL